MIHFWWNSLKSDLKCQQALVDLSSFEASLTIGAGRVRSSLVPRQVDEGELSVHLPPPTQNDLEHGVASRGVSVCRGLTWSPAGTEGKKHHNAYSCVQTLYIVISYQRTKTLRENSQFLYEEPLLRVCIIDGQHQDLVHFWKWQILTEANPEGF